MKRFVPLFEDFTESSVLTNYIKAVADTIENSQKFDYVGVEGNSINVSGSYENDDRGFHAGDTRLWNGYTTTYTAKIEFAITEDPDQVRLYSMGIEDVSTIITAVTIKAHTEYEADDLPGWRHKDDTDFSPMTPSDIEEFSDPESVGETFAEWLNDDWGGNGMINFQDILNNYDWDEDEEEEEEEADEDYEEEIDESVTEDSLEYFVEWVCEQLKIEKCPDIEIGHDHEAAVQMRSMAYFHPGEYRIFVLAGNRLKADWYRSLVHELTHAAQFERGEDLDGSTGSPHENEANSMAGQLLRDWGKKDPSIYVA